MKFLNEMKV